MNSVFEIEDAIQKLSPGELSSFREWFLGFTAKTGPATKDSAEATANQQAWLQAALEQGLTEAHSGRLMSASEAKSNMACFKEDWKRSRGLLNE